MSKKGDSLHLLVLPSPSALGPSQSQNLPPDSQSPSHLCLDGHLSGSALGPQENAQYCGGASDTSASLPLLLLPLWAWVLPSQLLR